MAVETKSSLQHRRILFFTNAEHGQANVCLATSQELLELGSEVHFASFAPIRETVTQALPSIVFHQVQGRHMKDVWENDLFMGKVRRAPNFFTMHWYLKTFYRSIFPWSGSEYVEIYNSVLEILDTVQPDMCVIDPAMNAALTACRFRKQPFIILAPNTIKDFALGAQPTWDQLAKYPCLASGFPYPLPWYLILLNIYYGVLAFVIAIFNFRQFKIMEYVKEHTGADVFGLAEFHFQPEKVAGVKIMVANKEELEWPLEVIPPFIIPCGPIIRPYPPVAEADPELNEWLHRGPTIYINFGTHAVYSLLEISKAIQQILDPVHGLGFGEKKHLQVLWKVKTKKGSNDDAIRAVLDNYIADDRVRIVQWLIVEPSAIMKHHNIAVVVSHGGANSFHEAVVAGKQQIIVPAWSDCFDFANRIEFLNIGIWPNKGAYSRVTANQLYTALVDILQGPRAGERRRNVRRLAALCNRNPGRVVAAKRIVAETEGVLFRNGIDSLVRY